MKVLRSRTLWALSSPAVAAPATSALRKANVRPRSGAAPGSASTLSPGGITRPGASSSDVLIDENRVAVGVHRDKTGGARRALVCLVHHLHALRLQLAL